MCDWLKPGPEEDVVVSTRVRLARNLEGLPFPHKLRGTAQEKEVADIAQKAFSGTDFEWVDTRSLPLLERQKLVEQHVVSPALIQWGGSCLLSPDRSVSVLIMEEDHFRLQCMTGGLSPEIMGQAAKALADRIGKIAPFAIRKDLGYLTSCPTNVGTGMRASAMVHLPALTMTGGIRSIFHSLGQIGFTARGAYGEGTNSLGDVYQISNQVTLGISQEDLLGNTHRVVTQLVHKEREAAEALYRAKKTQLEDTLLRSVGTLHYARLMDSGEGLTLLSHLILAARLELIKAPSYNTLHKLMTEIMPAMMGGTPDRDSKRARHIRETLAQTD